MGIKGNRATMTVGNTIYLFGVNKADFIKHKKWLLHEMEHVRQFKRYGFFRFIALYLLETMKKGYYNNRYELEARQSAGEYVKL
jgi:hypothetical protein